MKLSFEEAAALAAAVGVDLSHDCDDPACVPGGRACRHDIEALARGLVAALGDPDLRVVRRHCGEGWLDAVMAEPSRH